MTTTVAIISVAMIIMMIVTGTYDDHHDKMVIMTMITATYDLNFETSARKRLMVSLKLKRFQENYPEDDVDAFDGHKSLTMDKTCIYR